MNPQLSPAAQAVRDNYGRALFTEQYAASGRIEIAIAAALRAAAEHSVPDDSNGHYVYLPSLLAIADELEVQQSD